MDRGWIREGPGRTPVRPNPRDPLAERLIGPGKAFEIEEVLVGGFRQQVFKGAPRNLAQIFRQAAALGVRPMVVQDDVRLTYAEVFARAAPLARALRNLFGVKPGARVAIVMANRAEWVVSLIAVTAVGAVAALVNSRGAAEEMLRAITLTGCELAILDAERATLIGDDAPWPRIVVGAGFTELTTPEAGLTLDPVETDPEDGALILFTSGATGFPKGALLSHGALAHAASLSRMMGAMQDLRYEEETGERLPPERASMASPAVVQTPMFHLTGMLPVVRGMSLGATIHIVAKWNLGLLPERPALSR